MALETDGAGVVQASYVLGGRELVAQRRGGATSYYLHDAQGSTRALLDEGGALTDRYSYDAFGSERERQGTTLNPYRYTGQQLDALTGLYSLRSRYYSPADGRFLSRDTVGFSLENPLNLNRYAYVANNPIRYIDPSGKMLIEYEAQEEEQAEPAAVELTDIQEELAELEEDVNVDLELAEEAPPPEEPPQSDWYGARGPHSGRDFDPNAAGGPIRQLSTSKVRITERGIEAVEQHLSRFGPDEANEAMIARLRGVAEGEFESTPADVNFYTHELRESVRYRQLGWSSGQPADPEEAYDLWNNAHTATLEDYGLREGPGVLYHPDVDPYTH